MKMVTAIVNHQDARGACRALVRNRFYVTRLASSGGFLMGGNDTLLIVTEDERVDECIQVLASCCSQRTEVTADQDGFGASGVMMPAAVTVGGATIFVTNVEKMVKL